MGVDINMYLVKKINENEDEMCMTDSDFAIGRYSNWFDNLQNRGSDQEYEDLPVVHSIESFSLGKCSQKIQDDCKEIGYGFSAISVKDYFNWIKKSKPHVDAGWVTKYDAWAYKAKGIEPETIIRYPNKIGEENTYTEFITYINKYDPNIIVKNKIEDYIKSCNLNFFERQKLFNNLYLIFYFDC